MSLRVNQLTGFGGGGGLPVFNVTISSNKTNFILADELVTNHGYVSGTDAIINVTINASITCGANTTSLYGFRSNGTNSLGNGSKVNLTNNGTIQGRGGNGGAGGDVPACADTSGNPGGNGGPALRMDGIEYVITNGSGNIWGGGKGGNGGAGSAQGSGKGSDGDGGGGGGGGGGSAVGSGGAGGNGVSGTCDNRTNGTAGSPGTATAGGAGGSGNNGNNGAAGTARGNGNAVQKNSGTLTWISGGTSPNVEGSIV